MLDLVESVQSNAVNENASGVIATVGPEAARRLSRFFGGLADADIDSWFEWRGETARSLPMSADQAGSLRDWLNQVEPETEEIEVTGLMRLADSIGGRFAVESSVTGEVFEGRALEPALMTHVIIDEEYKATLSVVALRSELLDQVRRYYTLVSVEVTRTNSV